MGGPVRNSHKKDRAQDRAPYNNQKNNQNNSTAANNRGQGDARQVINRKNNNEAQPVKSGPLLTEVFVGVMPYLSQESHAKHMRDLLKSPKSMFMITSSTAQLSQKDLDEGMKCRSLIVCPSLGWYSKTNDDYFSNDGALTHANKWNGAVATISNDVARAVAKYKPMRTYLEIPTGQTSTHFGCVLAAVAQGHDFVCMNVNPIGKPNIAESPPDQQTKIWAGRVKYYLHAFHPRDRLLAQLSPNKGINVNNL